MADQEKSSPKPKYKKKPSIFLRIGKYFLILLFMVGQGFLAYAIVDQVYPDIYKKMNSKSPADYGTYVLDEIVVNPANTNGKRYLMVEISLELYDKSHIETLNAQHMRLKQALMEALSNRTIDELVQVEGRENLRSELIAVINSVVEANSVRNLYFTKYIIQ